MDEAKRGRRPRTPRAVSEAVGRLLMAKADRGDLSRGERAELAHTLHVTLKTLWNWEAAARRGEPSLPWGRRPHPEASRVEAERRVLEERARQGVLAGWRSLRAGFARRGEAVPTRLVQEALQRIKAKERHEERARVRDRRVSIRVLYKDAIWAADGFDVGWTAAGKVEAQLLRDPAAGLTLYLPVGPPMTGEGMVALLDRLRVVRGGLPLAFQCDRGPINRAEVLVDYLDRNLVVHILSRPRTPTDNPKTERAIGDLQVESGVPETGVIEDVDAVRARLERARRTLDQGRLWARHGYRTAVEADAALVRADTVIERKKLFDEATKAMRDAEAAASCPRAKYAARNAAAWRVLERFGLVKVTSGTTSPAPTPPTPSPGTPTGTTEAARPPEKGGTTGRADSRSPLLGQPASSEVENVLNFAPATPSTTVTAPSTARSPARPCGGRTTRGGGPVAMRTLVGDLLASLRPPTWGRVPPAAAPAGPAGGPARDGGTL